MDEVQPDPAGWLRWLAQHWPYWLPLLACLGIMAPRLIDAHFGLLDDGFNITAARQILDGDLSMPYDLSRGRFRPAYWLLFAALYGLGGLQPVWFFAANTLFFCCTTLGLVYLVRQQASALQAGLSGLFYALAVPVIENYYTFSKGEAFQLACLVLALIAILSLPGKVSRKRALGGRILIASFLVFLAATTKETTLVMVPVAGVWAGIAWWGKRRQPAAQRPALRQWLAVLASALIGNLAYLLSRTVALGSVAQVNQQRFDLTPGALIDSAVRWSGWLLRDFLFLVPLAILLAWLWIWRKKREQTGLLLIALVWMAAWIAIYLPWSSANDYFLLPFSLGAAVLTASAVAQAVESKPDRPLTRSAWVALLAIFGLLFAGSLLVGFSSARVQLSVDRANNQMLGHLAGELPQDALLLVNIQDPNEYFDEIRIYLNEILGRPDVTVQAVQAGQSLDLHPAEAATYLLAPAVQNQMLMTVRMGVIETTVQSWNAALPENLTPQDPSVFQVREKFWNFSIDFPRLFCGLIQSRGFCATRQPLLDRRLFQYGWDLYLLER